MHEPSNALSRYHRVSASIEEAAKLLCGVVDVYLGDFKYGNDGCVKRYSKVMSYNVVDM